MVYGSVGRLGKILFGMAGRLANSFLLLVVGDSRKRSVDSFSGLKRFLFRLVWF